MKKTTRIIKPELTPKASSLMEKLEKKGISRRDFIKYTAGTAALVGLGPGLLEARKDRDKHKKRSRSKKESRIFVFNFSHLDTSDHDLTLVAGNRIRKLKSTTSKVLDRYREKHPILGAVPDHHMTHHVKLHMPADGVQLCYVKRKVKRKAKRKHKSKKGESWDMAMFFYHLPASALWRAHEIRMALEGEAPIQAKWANYGLTLAHLADFSDPVGEDAFKDTNVHATAIVASHPEIACGDPASAAHIHTNIISAQSSTATLGVILDEQGETWATQVPIMDPNTGEQAINSHNELQYMPDWSATTNDFAGQAMAPALTSVKNDTSLGVNVTDVDPVATNVSATGDDPTQGAIWTLHDGAPAVDQSSSGLQGEEGFEYEFANQTPGHGYSVEVLGVEKDTLERIQIEIKTTNWFVRYLGLYCRFLDDDDNPIPVEDLTFEGEIDPFPLSQIGLNGEYDMLVDIIEPEFTILGMPVKSESVEFKFPLPKEATSVMILAGGLGRGTVEYPDTVNVGTIMTVIFNLSIPSLFLALTTGKGLPELKSDLEDMETMLWVLEMAVDFFMLAFKATTYDEPEVFAKMGPGIAEKLLDKGAERLDELIEKNLVIGEAEESMDDAIPIIGTFLSAVSAVGTIAEITETSCQTAQSPRTYVSKLTFTHDIKLTVHPDDDDYEFPAVATHYTATAIFDSGTPHTITEQMPGTTVSEPIEVTFKGVPIGGEVTLFIAFYSNTGWLAGKGEKGPKFNVSTEGALEISITITEFPVPITPDTVYSHKEVIVLDEDGNHQWQAQTSPPSELTPSGCNLRDDQLCELAGITISNSNASVGYTWKAYNAAVTNCETGNVGQVSQFANISMTQDPESEYIHSGCGFSGPVRMVYDLMGKPGHNFYVDPISNSVRQIRLTSGGPSFDGPYSNKSWGRFQFASDALLLHPAGQLISINEDANKIEVLTLPSESSPDSDAPESQVYSGEGIREGLVSGPTLAALDVNSTILILESRNNRIQAFDLGANPVPTFDEGAYHVPLIDQPTAYLDLSVEYTGYMYVLSYTDSLGTREFRLDIYTPGGQYLASTPGFIAARMAVNYWREIYALNYQLLRLPDDSIPERTEPSVSQWIPSTPETQ